MLRTFFPDDDSRKRLMARFGRVLTAMVTPFDEQGELERRCGGGAGEMARGTGQRGSGGVRNHRRGADALDRREAPTLRSRRERRDGPGDRGHDRLEHPPRHRPHGGGGPSRRRRDPRGVPVLQPPVAGRYRNPLPGDRGIDRSADRALRHPGAHRTQDRQFDTRASRDRCSQHRRPQGRCGEPGGDRRGEGDRARPTSRSIRATTR